jgi:hypothetical protein
MPIFLVHSQKLHRGPPPSKAEEIPHAVEGSHLWPRITTTNLSAMDDTPSCSRKAPCHLEEALVAQWICPPSPPRLARKDPTTKNQDNTRCPDLIEEDGGSLQLAQLQTLCGIFSTYDGEALYEDSCLNPSFSRNQMVRPQWWNEDR